MKGVTLFLLTLIAVIGLVKRGPAGTATDKPKAEEIISKHLDSIGTAEARAAGRPRVMVGTTHVTFRARGKAEGDGSCVLASQGEMNMVTMKFGGNDYPYEKIGFDGSKVTANQLGPGVYSNLGSFVRSYPLLLKNGLFGGSLSSAWFPLDLANSKAKLEYGGTKKIDSRQMIEIKYIPRGGSDLKISLFFDAETFQHVRSVYEHQIAAQMSRGGLGSRAGGVGREGELSASQTETRYELVEEFSDFKPEGGLTLPHTYKIRFSQVGAAAQYSNWVMTLQHFIFDQKMGPKDFDVSGN
jgi:hypothetical protein